MSLKKLFLIIFGIQFALFIGLGIMAFRLFRHEAEHSRSSDVHFRSWLLADELRQSSDDLTRMARTYVATGNDEYERQYWAVLDIRNGKSPRPVKYNQIYWDLITAQGQKPREDGAAISLHDLMIREGFTSAEFDKLTEAQEISDELVNVERIAMNAVKGLFDDGAGNFTVKKKPDRELAIRLMNDEAYHKTKATIMKPIDEFYVMFEKRTANDVVTNERHAKNSLLVIIVLVIVGMGIFVFSFVMILYQISRREKAEDALQESEKNLREAQRLAHIGSWTWTIATDTVKWSEELYHINGSDPNSPAPSYAEMSSCYTPESWKLLSSAVANTMKSGEPYELDLEMVRPDGATRHTFARGKADYDIDGKISGLHGTVQDITERKRAEDVIRAASLYTRNLIEASLDPLVTISPDGKITDVNEATEQVTGVSREQLIGSDFTDYFTEPDQARTGYEQVFSQGAVKDYPLAIRNTSGRITDVLYNATVYKNVAGEVEGVFAAARDITELKRTEIMLGEALEKMQKIFDSSPDAILLIDLNGMVIECNQSAVNLHGCSTKEELLGMNGFNLVVESERQLAMELLLELVTRGTMHDVELTMLRQDGSQIVAETAGNVLRDSSGKPIGLVVIVTDITERKQAETEIKLKNEELAKLNAEKDKFFSIIAHDLRSPFNSLLGFTQILAEELPTMDQDQVQKMAVSMRKSATNLFNLLENLLDWSRLQRGITTFNPESFFVMPKISGSLTLSFAAIKSKKIDITCDISEEIRVFADENMFESIIRNLISNAVKFTTPNGKIAIKAKVMGNNWVEFSIKDTGIGMNQEMAGNLFQVDINTSRKGTEGEPSTGLGLLICKDFIEKHGGKLWVESEEGKGTAFYFMLPDKSAIK